MRAAPNLAVERFRVRSGRLASSRFDGNNGAFSVPFVEGARRLSLTVIASDGMGWDHVSVSLPDRCPTWEMMGFVKDLFFTPEEAVVQFHPPRSVYRNHHPYCLHLWRAQGVAFPMPDPDTVAPAPSKRAAAGGAP